MLDSSGGEPNAAVSARRSPLTRLLPEDAPPRRLESVGRLVHAPSADEWQIVFAL
jgi:hypothetical protein